MTLSAGLILALAAAPPASPSPAAMPPRMAELVKQLKDPDWDTRMEAATSLGAFGPAAAPALPNLIEALKDPVPAVRMKAVDAIMFMRTAAAPAAPLLPSMLEDPDELVRVSVVVALPRIAAQPPTTAPLLKKMLADKAWPVRRQAALQLVEIGTEVPAAIPVLREGLSDPILPNRLVAMAALGRVAEPEEKKKIAAMAVALLGDHERETRTGAVRVLGALGAEGVPHLVPLITKATPDPEDRPVQVEAVRALGRIGPEARSALPALEQVAARKGMWAKMAQRSIAAIEGKASALPEEGAGPVPPIVPEKEDAGGAETPPAPSPRPSPSPQG